MSSYGTRILALEAKSSTSNSDPRVDDLAAKVEALTRLVQGSQQPSSTDQARTAAPRHAASHHEDPWAGCFARRPSQANGPKPPAQPVATSAPRQTARSQPTSDTD